MSCENTNARLQIKYTTVAGQVPTIPSTNDHNDGTWNPTDIYIGEFFLNSEDDLLWVRTLDGILAVGGTGGSASFIGDFVSKANGGTYSGPVFGPTFSAINMIATTISASAFDGLIFGSTGSTYYGDGSNLTGITTNWNGGTVSDPTQFDNIVDFNQDISINDVYYGTLGYIGIHSDVIVDGGLSASYFIGDGSLITNLPIGPTANDYTTNAYLDGNIIRYDRTDLADAYSVDLSPILFTQSVSSFAWDSATNDATIYINDGSFYTINLGIFNNISTAIINATDVYATNFYGTFNGTYSNDIYTISATLSGTTAIFDRTDGVTYSLDLSTFSGGGGATGATGPAGTQSLAQTLAIDNQTDGHNIIITGTDQIISSDTYKYISMDTIIDVKNEYTVGDITSTGQLELNKGVELTKLRNTLTDNSSGDISYGTVEVDNVSAKIESSIFGSTLAYVTAYNIAGPAVEIQTSDTFSNVSKMNFGEGVITASGSNATTGFRGIEYGADYSADYTNRSLVDKEYVDNLPGGETLEQTLTLGNTIGAETINFGGFANIQANGTNIELKADANVSGDLYLNSLTVADDFTSGIEQISFSDITGTTKTSNISLSPGQTYEAHTLNDGALQQTTIIQRQTPKTVELITDQSTGFDTEYRRELGVNGATDGSLVKVRDNNALQQTQIKTTISSLDLYSEDITAQHLTGLFVTNAKTGSLDALNSSNGSAANAGVFVDGPSFVAGSYLSATDGTTTYFSQLSVHPDDIKVNGTNPAFAGIEYDNDYSTNYTNRSLVDKEYVDTAVAGAGATPSFSQVLLVGNSAGSTSINMNSNNITGISSLGNGGGTTIEMINIINMANLALMYNT
jgi:hypothetical protein